MLLPNFVSVVYMFNHVDPATNQPAPMPLPALLVMIGTAMHMVFSIMFHVNAAMHLEEDEWDHDLKLWIMPRGRRWHPTAHNSYRRLDQVGLGGERARSCMSVVEITNSWHGCG